MKVYVRRSPLTNKKEFGIKMDKTTMSAIGSIAGLAYSKLNRDSDLKDAAAKYILMSVDYNTKAENAKTASEKAEYRRKAKEYEDKAREISTLINKRNKAIKENSPKLKDKLKEMKETVETVYNNGEITKEEYEDYLSKLDLNNYYLKEELDYEL